MPRRWLHAATQRGQLATEVQVRGFRCAGSGARGLEVASGDAREEQRAELGDEEERAGGDDEAIGQREELGGGERGDGVGCGDGGDFELLRGGADVVDAGGARAVD